MIAAVTGYIALPPELPISFKLLNQDLSYTLERPALDLTGLGIPFSRTLDLQFGLDIQGGTRVTLDADMSAIPEADRVTALESAREIVNRRVDLYGVSEVGVRTNISGETYRIDVEIPGVSDVQEAINTIGTTAQLDFRAEKTASETAEIRERFAAEASVSAQFEREDNLQQQRIREYLAFLDQFEQTDLKGKDLSRAVVQFDPQTAQPVVALSFTPEGREKFAEITKRVQGRSLAIFLDDGLVSAPVVNEPILDGNAVISGGFDLDTAKQLSIQLNAGALPVPLEVVSQETIEASLGQEAVERTAVAGGIGVVLVGMFMVLLYGWSGVIAVMALGLYGLITISIFKLWPVTLTLPGIAGVLLSVGMAVDSNILIFERMKEELRRGRPFRKAMELGFGRAWDSIKDANIATLFIAFILFNPFDFAFLNRSGPVRGFALTLALGVGVSIFTGVFVTRTLMRAFLAEPSQKEPSLQAKKKRAQ